MPRIQYLQTEQNRFYVHKNNYILHILHKNDYLSIFRLPENQRGQQVAHLTLTISE